jgi:glucose 1-dehydrogenase
LVGHTPDIARAAREALAASRGAIVAVGSVSVSPGLVRTTLSEPIYRDEAVLRARMDAVPLGRIATPRDVARAIVYLAGPDAGYATGIDLRIDGGLADSVLATIPGQPR